MIRRVELKDAEAICNIYNWYIENTLITFEEEAVTVEEIEARIRGTISSMPYIVCEIDGRVLGYAYASKWRTRSAYRFSVESTVYVDGNSKANGIGTRLYQQLLDGLKDKNIHSVLGVITLPNEASVALHEKLGFSKVAHIKNVGYKFGEWIDVGYWQYEFEL